MNLKNQFKTILLTTAVLLATATAQATPTTIGTYEGNGADLSIRGGAFATGNHGTNLLRVRNAANLGDARKLYMRFDLSKLATPAKNATDASVTLQLLPAEGNSPPDKVWTFDVFGLNDGLPEENWGEYTATWNDAPVSDPKSPVALTTNKVTPLGQFTIVGKGKEGDKIVFSSPAMTKFLQADTNGLATFIVTRREQGNDDANNVTHIFASKESSKFAAPVLTVAFNGEDVSALADPNAPSPAYPLPTKAADGGAAQEINAFWEADKKQLPPKNAVLFMGSSSVRIWTSLAQDFPEIPVINRGFGGSQIFESTYYADYIAFPYAPKMIVMFAGTNDLAYGNRSPQQVLKDYQDFVATVHAKLPNVRFVFLSISPTVQRWNNESNVLETNYLINRWVHENDSPALKLSFLDTHSQLLTLDGGPSPKLLQGDGLHLNADGYKLLVSIVKPRILALAAEAGVPRLDAEKK